MSDHPTSSRTFLLLQGPHGPFFWKLGKMLRASGSEVWRVGFNAGDRAFWPHKESFIPFAESPDYWAPAFIDMISQKGITDIVLYGDTRPVHAIAIECANNLNLRVHVFEEGYIRPFWVTYERGGSNGNSALMDLSVAQMQAALETIDPDTIEPPAHWGDMREHIFYGALYHWFIMFRNQAFKNGKRHRELTVAQEFCLYFKRLILMPVHRESRRLKTRRIKNSGHPYHVALLQLEHDASFQMHSPYETMPDFIEEIIAGFAKGAPKHHHLVFKGHPLETGRRNLTRDVKRIAQNHGIASRVHYVGGGKLAQLLNFARSAVTVNSTSGQQVLARGLPIKVFGRAVFDKPEFISQQTLSEFFNQAQRPNKRAYADYRQFLLETSQIPGGFYSAAGRRQLLRLIVDMMLAQDSPYEALMSGTPPPRLPIRPLE